MKKLDEAVRVIRQGSKFVVACHGKPDGDTLGSALAIARAVRTMGKEAVVVSQDGVPEVYSFLPESDTVVHTTSRRDFDTAIICDVQEPLRAERTEEIVKDVPTRLFIDHHPTEACIDGGMKTKGKIVVCDTKAAATAELMVEVIDALGVELDEVLASQLMGGIVTDTGSFRFTNVTPKTFAVAGRLASLGANAPAIARFVYETRSFVATKLLGKALASLESDISGRVTWARITRDDFESLDASDEDTEAIVNLVRSVKGAEVGILFRDLGKDVRISLRSHGTVDVSKIAQAFGGGGHKAASGCTLNTTLDEAVRLVVAESIKCVGS